MIIVQEVLVSDELTEERFTCDLSACQGACCWEGDYGAPLDRQEMELLETIYDRISPFLSERGKECIAKKGLHEYYPEIGEHGTTLLEDGSCAFLVRKEGIARCGIELAHEAGAISFVKPVSCHLYPVRVTRDERTGFEALNYDRWEICSAACHLGEKLKKPVYEFASEAIIRKYGEEFYEELDAIANHLSKTE